MHAFADGERSVRTRLAIDGINELMQVKLKITLCISYPFIVLTGNLIVRIWGNATIRV